MLRQRSMVRIPATVRIFIEGRRHDAHPAAAQRPGKMRYIAGLLGIMMMWGNSLPLAAQEVSTPEATVAADSGLAVPAGAFQQLTGPDGAPPTPQHTGIRAMIKGLGADITHLPSRQNLLWVGIGAGLSAAVHPLDDQANEDLSGRTLNKLFTPGAIIGQSYTLLAVSSAVYAVGRIKGEPRVSHMGMDLIRSLVIAEFMTQSLKYTVRRERPDGSGANSFPSGHAADTMAFATALERHLGWRFAVPAYMLASYVAMSRLHDNVHFLSDVTAGATVGIIAGRTVTRHGRDHFPVTLMTVPGGVGIMYVRNGH
jgi:membrane-associated phospholipid phosphatase